MIVGCSQKKYALSYPRLTARCSRDMGLFNNGLSRGTHERAHGSHSALVYGVEICPRELRHISAYGVLAIQREARRVLCKEFDVFASGHL